MSAYEQNVTSFESINRNNDEKFVMVQDKEATESVSSSSVTMTTTEVFNNCQDTGRANQHGHKVVTTESTRETVVYTRSREETEAYLKTHGIDICKNVEPIRQTDSRERNVDYEQHIIIQYFRPPTPPPPGPLIIQQVQEQQAPPPPLVIYEQPIAGCTSPELILREEPPKPPPVIPSETRYEYLPAKIAPPRSVVIHRCPAPPQRPSDIRIERWLPYGPQPERQTKVLPPAPSAAYSKPTCTIYEHDASELQVTQKLHKCDVTVRDPVSYAAEYSGSLLDSDALERKAFTVGAKNISVSAHLSIGTATKSKNVDDHKSNDSVDGSNVTQRIAEAQEHKIISSETLPNTFPNREPDTLPVHHSDYNSVGSTGSTRQDYTTGDATVSSSYITQSRQFY